MLSSRTYDNAKKAVQIWIPATSSLYFGLAAIWGLPAAEEVVGTLAVLATFLGVILGISSKQYEASGAAYDGNVIVRTNENGSTTALLELDGDPEEILENKNSIRFKVLEAPDQVHKE